MDIPLPIVKKPSTRAPQQILKNVVVPVNSRSSLGSSLSSVRDPSSDFDTPATSVAVTPAESLAKEELASRNFGKLSKSSVSNALSEESTNGKRKRSRKDEFIQTKNTNTVQALQEKEVKGGWDLNLVPSMRGRKGHIQDSEDDDPLSSPKAELSNIPSISTIKISEPKRPRNYRSQEDNEEDIDDDFAARVANPKKVKMSHRASQPSRAVRGPTENSMNGRGLHLIVDSEDTDISEDVSSVSLFASDFEIDALSEFEDSDADIDDFLEESNDPTRSGSAVATASFNVFTAPASVPRRRRARATQVANHNRIRHHYGRMEDRV